MALIAGPSTSPPRGPRARCSGIPCSDRCCLRARGVPGSRWDSGCRQEGDRRQDHPGRAEPALQPVLGPERLLHRVHRPVLREPFDGRDRGPVSLDGEPGTGLHRLVVDEHRARATLAGVATDLRAGERRHLSEEVDQQEPWFDLPLQDPAVHGDPNWKLQRGLPGVMGFACVRTAGILCPSARSCKGRGIWPGRRHAGPRPHRQAGHLAGRDM